MARVLLLASRDSSSWIVARALRQAGHDPCVLIAPKPSGRPMIRHRLRRLGAVTVAGQIVFQLYARLRAPRHEERRRAILSAAGLDDTPLPESEFTEVPGANSPETISLLRRHAPKVVVINGTEILRPDVLNAVDVPFINVHAGITPAYRGVHGGYWARAEGDDLRCGATVHLVDPGVDTGDVLHQVRIAPTQQDSFFSYPTLQLAAAIPALVEAVAAALEGKLHPRAADGESRQWYHPTIWSYVATGLRRGVW